LGEKVRYWAEIDGLVGGYGQWEVSDDGLVRQVRREHLKREVEVAGRKVLRFKVGDRIVQRVLDKLVRRYFP